MPFFSGCQVDPFDTWVSVVTSFFNIPKSLSLGGSCLLVTVFLSKLVIWFCGKNPTCCCGSCFLPPLLYQAKPLFYFPCPGCKKWCGFLTSFLHTRSELKVLGLTGERFPVLDGNLGFLGHLLAVWVPTELRARRIEAAQDFQGFLMWSCKLFFGMSHIHLWGFLGYSVSNQCFEWRKSKFGHTDPQRSRIWLEWALLWGNSLQKSYCSS